MASNGAGGLRTQYPYDNGALSPRPLYDFPSPTSNYPSSIGASPSPGFYPMAYQNTPRFGGSAFLPPPDIFVQDAGVDARRDYRARRSDVLTSDPVAMHLLVETAVGDSQYFDILSVEEVEAQKQEQRTLDVRLGTVRRKLESETKIRDAARSLNRLSSKNENGHKRGLNSRGSNVVKDDSARSEAELDASNKKVEDLTRELLEIESRMRTIDMQLLMHTAGVLQLTHNGPTKRRRNSQASAGGVQRPDSPASIEQYTYETRRNAPGSKDEDSFDDRSLYRSPENLDSLMNVLQNGTHHHSEAVERQSAALSATTKRLEDLNDRLRGLIVQANPERNRDYSPSPRNSGDVHDASELDRQLDILDQGLRDMGAEHTNVRDNTGNSLNAVEGRLEGINNHLYAMLSKADENSAPPPPVPSGDTQATLNYMEDLFYNVEQLQHSMSEQNEQLRAQLESAAHELEEHRSKTSNSSNMDTQQYETTLMGLWSIILAGEEEARRRKQQRRELLASDPGADEELSQDEDFDPNEQFSLNAFSTKVQWLYSRASSLKEKQSILVRQIKQQRELNSRSDAQKEEQFSQLKEQVLSARSEKISMENELERAMSQLQVFDTRKVEVDSQALRKAEEHIDALQIQLHEAEEEIRADQEKIEADTEALHNAQDRIHTLEMQLQDAQDEARVDTATMQAELSELSSRIEETLATLRVATTEREAADARGLEATNNLNAKEEELRDLEGEVVRLTTELTFAKAELDGAYGTRAERAAKSGGSVKKELEELSVQNAALLSEIESLRKAQDAASQSEAEARESERNLKQELSAMATEYEALTRDSIQNEKDRDILEASIDKLRDEREALELEISDEKVKWLGVRSPSVANGVAMGSIEATSIRMLREDFRKMIRDRTSEGLRALRVSDLVLIKVVHVLTS
jgi:hypothetical protein